MKATWVIKEAASVGSDTERSDEAVSVQPLISVIIPSYNRASRITNSIASVLAQTYENFELIVVDDASDDDTEDVVERFGDSRIRYVRHETNRGGSAARNTGATAARGDILAFLDSDDEWLPEKLQLQLECLRGCGGNVGLVYCGSEYVLQDGRRVYPKLLPLSEHRRDLLLTNIIGSASVAMLPRKVFMAVGGFDECLPARQDLDLWIRIAQRYEVNRVPRPLARIVFHDSGERISNNIEHKLHARELLFEKHSLLFEENRIAAQYLTRSARICHFQGAQAAKARSILRNALRHDLLYLPAVALLLSTFIPLGIVNRLLALRRRWSGGQPPQELRLGVIGQYSMKP